MVEWCNNNIGFASVMLSLLTLVVSIIAVIVSIQTARLPYKKKMLVESGSYISNDGTGIHITVTNIGNRNIKIKKIGILIGKMVYINKNTLFESQILLQQGDTTSQYFEINDLKSSLAHNQISNIAKMIAIVEDTEGKKYKKRLSRVYEIFK